MKLVNGHKQVYVINKTMQAELDFICQALQEDSVIDFVVPFGLVIPRTPTTSLYGDSSLLAWGRYSTMASQRVQLVGGLLLEPLVRGSKPSGVGLLLESIVRGWVPICSIRVHLGIDAGDHH